MSSKNADSAPAAPAWSITGRLTRYYLAATAALLLLATGYLYWMLEHTFEVRNRGFIGSKAQVMHLLLREYRDKPDVVASEVEHEASANQPLRYFLRILDARRRIVLETTGMSALVPPVDFPAPGPAGALPAPVLHRDPPFLLTAVLVPPIDSRQEPHVVQIALDLSRQRELLGGFRNRLLAVLGLGIVLAAGAGAFIARRGLRPLAQITAATQRVTASQLHERVSTAAWPAELTALAGAFDAMLVRLEESFNRLSRFSADMAHALRNPINNLRGGAEVALTRARPPEEYQQTLASHLEELERLSSLIDNLLFLARADHPDTALRRVPFTARREMDAVRDFYEALAAEQRVAVVCEGDVAVAGDPTLFRRAVSNLLGNALKHTPAGGTVTLTAAGGAGGRPEVVVRDTGAGIPSEALPRVFDRFFQADPSRDLTAKGSGLGLPIVQSIMRLHGGSVELRSEVGQGTTVTLRFPAANL